MFGARNFPCFVVFSGPLICVGLGFADSWIRGFVDFLVPTSEARRAAGISASKSYPSRLGVSSVREGCARRCVERRAYLCMINVYVGVAPTFGGARYEFYIPPY